ncbi:MAG: hypothetical protein ACM3SV_12180 [Betaproteobacteria bacterium]
MSDPVSENGDFRVSRPVREIHASHSGCGGNAGKGQFWMGEARIMGAL